MILPERLTLQLHAMCLMNDPIEHSIGDGGIGEEGMPLLSWVLGSDEQRSRSHTPVDNIQQNLGSRRRHLTKAEVIKDEKTRFGERKLELWQRAVVHSLSDGLVEAAGRIKRDRHFQTTCLIIVAGYLTVDPG